MLEPGYDFEGTCKMRLGALFEKMQPESPISAPAPGDRGVEFYQARVTSVFSGCIQHSNEHIVAPAWELPRPQIASQSLKVDLEVFPETDSHLSPAAEPMSSMPPPKPRVIKAPQWSNERPGFTKYSLDLRRQPPSAQPTDVLTFINEVFVF